MSELKYSRQTCIEGWKQEKLSKAKVLMIGAGALGNHVGIGLIGLGIGYIHIYDMDLIEPHNLNRQSLFCTSDIGKMKSNVLKDRLTERNDSVKVFPNTSKVTEDNIPYLLDDIDVVIDCVDNADTRRLLSKQCIIKNIPLIHGAISFDGGQIGVLTRHTPCASCIYPPEENIVARPCRDEILPGVVYSSQIIAGLMVEQVRKVLNPLPGELPPIGPLLYYYPNQLNHFVHTRFERREGCTCIEYLEDLEPEILENERKERKKKDSNTDKDLAKLFKKK